MYIYYIFLRMIKNNGGYNSHRKLNIRAFFFIFIFLSDTLNMYVYFNIHIYFITH